MTDSALIPTGPIPDSHCPGCGKQLVVITKKHYIETTKHKQFVGCQGYPRCNYTALITDEIRAKMEQARAEREAMPAEF